MLGSDLTAALQDALQDFGAVFHDHALNYPMVA